MAAPPPSRPLLDSPQTADGLKTGPHSGRPHYAGRPAGDGTDATDGFSRVMKSLLRTTTAGRDHSPAAPVCCCGSQPSRGNQAIESRGRCGRRRGCGVRCHRAAGRAGRPLCLGSGTAPHRGKGAECSQTPLASADSQLPSLSDRGLNARPRGLLSDACHAAGRSSLRSDAAWTESTGSKPSFRIPSGLDPLTVR